MGRRLYGVTAACVLASAVAWGQAAQPPYTPRFERPVVTSGSGAHRLGPDVVLLSGASPFARVRTAGAGQAVRAVAYGGLADLRLMTRDGREIGYLLVYEDPVDRWMAGDVIPISPVETAAKKTSGFELDLGTARALDAIRVEGVPAPFLKPLVLEGSGDRERWSVLAAEATLFDLPAEKLQQLSVAFPAGTYRYLRATWDDTHSARVPMPRVVEVRSAGETRPAAPLTAGLAIERSASEPRRSRYRVRLPRANLPIVALAFDVGGGHVYRAVTVSEARLAGGEAVPTEIGRGTIARVTRSGATASQLRIPIAPPREAELDVLIEDGSNLPLDVKGIAAEFAELPWIYFEAPGEPVVARYGASRAQPPSYDLEAARASIRIAEVPEASWGEPREIAPAAPAAMPAPLAGAEIDPAAFRFQRALPDGPSGLSALILDADVLAHSRGPSQRFADVRIVDDGGRQVPYLIERREEPLTLELEPKSYQPNARELRPNEGSRRSAYLVRLPYEGLPDLRIVIETSARVFQRNVQAGIERPPDRRRRENWFEVRAASTWQHADESRPAPALTLAVGSGVPRDLVIVVEEGDNQPLPIAAVRGLLPSYRFRFHRRAGPLRVVYGRDDAAAPQYDLVLLAPQVMGAMAREIAAAPAVAAAPAAPQLLSPWTFWIGLALSVIVLIAIIARLARS